MSQTTTPTGISQSALNEVTFISGVDQNGLVASPSFASSSDDVSGQVDNTGSPDQTATYGTQSNVFKWGASGTPGTSGGTINYYFDPASNWTDAEQAVFVSSMALWSAVANVTFAPTTVVDDANLVITRGSDGKAYQAFNNNTAVPVGTNQIGLTTTSVISIDTSTSSYGPLTSITANDGFPAMTVVHEVGHALGLGHGGPYNGQVIPPTQQYSAYDSRLWSVMSYISPMNTTAKYYGSYTVTGTNWGALTSSETWMPLDILAIQRLYGVAVNTPLSGGQVFGFNCNITGALQPYFDFQTNTTPVLTLWDKGTGNTLDLSGYSTPETVNLNPGTFSSFDGMTNNLAIAYATAIDTAVGGSGNDVFDVNADPDTINGMGGANTVVFSGARASYSLQSNDGTVSVTLLNGGVTDTLMHITTLQFADATVATSSIACFTPGTRIATPTGEAPVESLAIGDLVLTAAGEHRAIKWIGRRSYAGPDLGANPRVQPIRLRAGSLGDGLPRRDLLVSPEHAMLLDGLLIPARCLVNGVSIVRTWERDRVDYYHVELDSHDIILAEYAPSETFVDDDSRAMFDNAAEYGALYGDPVPAVEFCAPRVEEGYAVEAIWQRLAALVPARPLPQSAYISV